MNVGFDRTKPHYELVTPLKEVKSKELKKQGLRAFSQVVHMGGRSLKVTVYYPINKRVDIQQAKSDIEKQIIKTIHIADAAGMGTDKDLVRMSIREDSVTLRHRTDEGSKVTSLRLGQKEELERQLGTAGDDEKKPIQQKLDVLNAIAPKVNVPPPIDPIVADEIHLAKEELEGPQAQFSVMKGVAAEKGKEMQDAEMEYSKAQLDRYEQFQQEIDATNDPGELQEIRERFREGSLEQKKAFDDAQAEKFEALTSHLVQMSKSYNECVEKRKELESKGYKAETYPELDDLKAKEAEMLKEINDLNATLGKFHLSTNTASNAKSLVTAYAAVVEKKLALKEEILRLEGQGALSSKEKSLLNKLKEELLKAPSPDLLKTERKNIEAELAKESKLTGIQDAKTINKTPKALEWGKSHLNTTLTDPANWTDIHTASVKFSSQGKLYVSVNVNKPMNIDERGGVPAGLRGKGGYNHRTTNLYMTTGYVLDDEGVKHGEQVSFRGGQFPSVAAAKEAIMSMLAANGGRLENLHISALLTPTALTLIKEDRHLLAAHKQNVEAALQELVEEGVIAPETLKNLTMSNFGVNEGAVGEKKMLGFLRLRLGWHTSISRYTNDAVNKLNQKVSGKLTSIEDKVRAGDMSDETIKELDSMGAILQVGQEMEAVWARNDYANAKAGNNQFKLPALWKAMDGLLGIMSYIDCMSGKDRTGKVESNAKEYSDEIAMNIADQKKALAKKFQSLREGLQSDDLRDAWDGQQKVLTAACWLQSDLEELAIVLNLQGEDAFKAAVAARLQEKINAAKTGLGVDKGPDGFMQSKGKFSPATLALGQGTLGIPKNTPKIEQGGARDAQLKFPKLAVGSIYQSKIPIAKMTRSQLARLHPDKKKELENRQREAVNRRLSQLSGSLQITQANTGKAGFKVEGGDPLARFSSGFDRDYVVYRLLTAKEGEDPGKLFRELTGLNELDASTRGDLVGKMQAAIDNGDYKQQVDAIIKVLREVEHLKMESLAPKAKVKA